MLTACLALHAPVEGHTGTLLAGGGSAGGAAAAWCRSTAAFFGVVPYKTWGTLPVEQHATWAELACDDLLERPASASLGPAPGQGAATPQRHAYVSSMCGDATYLPAALVLGHSLNATVLVPELLVHHWWNDSFRRDRLLAVPCWRRSASRWKSSSPTC